MAFGKHFIFALAMAGLAGTALAQTSTPLSLQWKVQADDPASTFILSTTNNCRGMFLNTNSATGGSLLVASRDNNNLVRRLDPATGVLKDPAVMPGGYSGTATTFAVNKVVVDSDGVIYVAGLGTASTAGEQHFRLYRHSDEFSGPQLVADVRTDNFTGNGGPGVNARLGDDMDIIGSGNNTKIIVVGSGGSCWVFTTADNGATFTGQALTCTPALLGTPNVAWDPTTPNRFWYRDATPNIYRAYDISGTTATGASGAGNELPGTSVLGYSPIDIGLINGVNSAILGIGASAATTPGKAINVYRLSDLREDFFGLGSEFEPGGAKANANASGDVYLDSANSAIYVLYTNNSVTKYTIPGASVGQWGKY